MSSKAYFCMYCNRTVTHEPVDDEKQYQCTWCGKRMRGQYLRRKRFQDNEMRYKCPRCHAWQTKGLDERAKRVLGGEDPCSLCKGAGTINKEAMIKFYRQHAPSKDPRKKQCGSCKWYKGLFRCGHPKQPEKDHRWGTSSCWSNSDELPHWELKDGLPAPKPEAKQVGQFVVTGFPNYKHSKFLPQDGKLTDLIVYEGSGRHFSVHLFGEKKKRAKIGDMITITRHQFVAYVKPYANQHDLEQLGEDE